MTFDERINRLTERHEALTQTVGLIAHQLGDVTKLVTDIAEGTARLLRLAENHGRRLDKLEGSTD